MPTSRIESISTLLLTIAAVTIAAVLVWREVGARRLSQIGESRDGSAAVAAEWSRVLDAGIAFGPDSAAVMVVVFSDLECPFCRQFHETLRALEATRQDRVRWLFVHFPIASHRFARPAARAAECAGREGHFGSMIDAIFAKQDSLGLRPWDRYATDAGIRDATAFEGCLAETSEMLRVERGRQIGMEIGVRGTPTVLINGLRLSEVPSREKLVAAVDAIVQGSPMSAWGWKIKD